MKVTGYAKSVIGGREGNQDSFLCWNERGVFAVADGVGGGLRGEVASQMAADGMKALPEGSTDLKPIFLQIQEAVLKEALDSIGEALMGTTLTAVTVKDGQLYLCHVGDSRCYVYSESVLRALTIDHEIYDEALGGAVLASYMGIPQDVHPLTIQLETVPLKAGDRVLLCSDGLYKQIEEPRIAQLIKEQGATPDQLLETLTTEAAKAPYSDNVTVLYIEID